MAKEGIADSLIRCFNEGSIKKQNDFIRNGIRDGLFTAEEALMILMESDEFGVEDIFIVFGDLLAQVDAKRVWDFLQAERIYDGWYALAFIRAFGAYMDPEDVNPNDVFEVFVRKNIGERNMAKIVNRVFEDFSSVRGFDENRAKEFLSKTRL